MNTINVLHGAPITLAWFNHDELGELPPLTRLLFIGLQCMTDRAGTIADDPERIGKTILRFDGLSTAEIDEMLRQLERSRMITRHEQGGRRLIEVSGLRKKKNRPRA